MTDAIIEAAARALFDANLFAGPQTCEVIVATVTPMIRAAALERALEAINDSPDLFNAKVAIRALLMLTTKEQP